MEIEGLLNKNFRELCDNNEELKELKIEKQKLAGKLLKDQTKFSLLESMCKELNNFYMRKKKEFFFENLENFIYINYLTKECKEKVMKELDNIYFETTNETPKIGKFSEILKKIIEFENELKIENENNFFIYDDLSSEADGTEDRMLFKAMLLTGEQLKEQMVGDNL